MSEPTSAKVYETSSILPIEDAFLISDELASKMKTTEVIKETYVYKDFKDLDLYGDATEFDFL